MKYLVVLFTFLISYNSYSQVDFEDEYDFVSEYFCTMSDYSCHTDFSEYWNYFRDCRASPEEVLLVEKDYLKGLIDTTGTLILDLQFDGILYCDGCSGTKFWLLKDNLWGLYDQKKDSIIIPLIYPCISRLTLFDCWGETADYFRFSVRYRSVKGIIDSVGTVIMEPRFDYLQAICFSDGTDQFLVMNMDNHLWGIVDSDGNTVLKPTYTAIRKLGGYCNWYMFTNGENGSVFDKWGSLGKDGKIIEQAIYSYDEMRQMCVDQLKETWGIEKN